MRVMGHTLDVPLTQQDPVKQIGHAIDRLGRAMVILDNCEQVVDHASTALAAWLDLAPRAVFIVTTRHRLALRREKLLVLEPLQVPSHNVFEEIAQSDAVQLFVTRATEQAHHFALDQANAHALAALTRALDGLPLAIELAAARSRVMSPATMLKKMTRPFDLLKGKRRDLNHRQATLRGALEWSWALLEPWEQSTLAQASVFEGGFTLEAAEAVIDVDRFDDAPFVMDVIESLVDKSLIRSRVPDVGDMPLSEPRFSLLASIQAFAAERVSTWGHADRQGVERRQAQFFSLALIHL